METTIQASEISVIKPIFQKIHEIRGQKVIFDFDLAELYEVEKRVLNQSVKRNINRFPSDFMFQITKKEAVTILKSQIVISKQQLSENEENRGGSRYLPYAFTEQGIAMLSSVLRSEKAIEVNIAIMRAFVAMRQYALNYADLSNRLEEFIKTSDTNFSEVFSILDELTAQKKLYENRKPIGFIV
ncbi:MAG: ORF6N domain-containing protein [Bacteroidales bacterium]|nr:ORF6N domain-containing protein [Bacteroidales bacterium]